ncbi:formin-like protein 13 [Notolabrus celidotus]|uniref:formin-like protein 13 n=1 Tax=Notolabrus celidotus TaxID=1203425 RepID=UPI0014906F49|nr:formin-like protein 13 [Notolabrus celidotus]
MPSLGSRKRDTLPKMDKQTDDLPQLSNEMQLSIMNRVKSGELSIEDALNQAREGRKELLKQRSLPEEEQESSQYNFSVYKHGRYRWQKRVLQIDFTTKMLCSIERGIIKRQLLFSKVKSCDDGAGTRFTISFKGHHDYEMEANSMEDKHKMMELVSRIIYGNIYRHPGEGSVQKSQQPQEPESIREGVLLLHRGGLASFRWVKYEVKLHPGQLTLVPLKRRVPADAEVTSWVPRSTVIHLSDGDTSVQKPPSPDTFTLITHKNEYQFKIPLQDRTSAPGAIQRERDSWVKAIDKLCNGWKRRSMGEHMFVAKNILRNISITEDAEDGEDGEDAEDAEDTETELEPSGGSFTHPPDDNKNADPSSSAGDHLSAGDTSQSRPSADYTKPVPKPRNPMKTPSQLIEPENSPPVPSPTSPGVVGLSSPTRTPPSPLPTVPTSPSAAPESHEPRSPVVKIPRPFFIPAPPPLPFKFKLDSKKPRTKAFHWDVMGSDKIAKSFWIQGGAKRVEIDTSRLFEQFAVKDLGSFSMPEQSNTQQIILNAKIAHNFNIFLKSFLVQPGELKDKLFIINEEDGGLSDEHITSLRRYVPTLDDVEKYKSHKGPVSELHIVDQYMMEMCNIPHLSTQLDLLLTLRELPNSMNELQPLINQKIRMCTQLNNCRSFVSVLEYLLAIGNYLNDNARKEKAKGFRLSSLTKLPQLRGREKEFTLLHALVEQIMLHEPCLATFTQELAEFETVPGASIKGLTAEIDVLKNELQKVVQYKKISRKRNTGVLHPNFTKDLKMAIEKYNMDLAALTKTCEEMKKLYSVILVKFGEPADQDSQELFGLICQFVHDFKRAHAEII